MNLLFTILLFFVSSALSAETRTIASHSTSIEDQDEGVRKNIYIACRKLNGYAIQPGSVFSFSSVVGEGSAKNGFVNGRVLYREEVRYEPGGGLCQVSSTVFNAMLAAGFTIVERHRHFQPVAYVPPGLDATIKYGKKDLRMKNPYGFSVYIEAASSGKSLTLKLKAASPMQFRYEIFTEEEETELPLGKEGENTRKGLNVHVYRRKFEGSKFIENFLLYKDYYPARYER
jgi:vancomycin resistance protein YoaR